MKNENPKAVDIRVEVLKKCYSIPGYKNLPLDEKNKTYDKIKAEYISKMN